MCRLRFARRSRRVVAALLGAVLLSSTAFAEQALVAVAANFTTVAEQLVEDFEAASDHEIVLTSGSTGKLYAQLRRGAPYDVFLAADRERPEKLIEAGLVSAADRFTYARGRLVVWGPKLGFPELGPAGAGSASDAPSEWSAPFASPGILRVALANPDLAPYGAAARQVLEAHRLWSELEPRLVFGENVGQAFSMVASGNAQLGLLARSSVVSYGASGARLIPETLHGPIRQDAVLLRRAEGNPAARAFFDFLRSPAARRRLLDSGYDTP